MNEIHFTGWLAELIALLAERKGMTPEEYVLSFFDERCIAPDKGASSFCPKGAMH